MSFDMCIVAQAQDGSYLQLLFWLVVLACGFLAIGVAAIWARKYLLNPNNDDEEGDNTLTLEALRQLRKRGELTEAEYEATRTIMLEQYRNRQTAKEKALAAKAEELDRVRRKAEGL